MEYLNFSFKMHGKIIFRWNKLIVTHLKEPSPIFSTFYKLLEILLSQELIFFSYAGGKFYS